MTPRSVRLLLTTIALICAFAAPAAAQDDFTFDEGAAEEMSSEQEELAAYLEEGQALYKNKRYPEASNLFYKIVLSEDPGADALRQQAEYELGKTLFLMGLYQGALDYFGRVVDVGEAHPYFKPTLRGLVLLTDVIPSDPTLLLRLSAYKDSFPNDVPKKYRPQFAYLVGRELYSNGLFDEAIGLLDSIPSRDERFLRARYIMGVSHAALYDAEGALDSFRQVLRVLVAREQEEGLEPAERDLLETTYIGMARVFYSAGRGNYAKALKYYDKVPRTSPNWPKALFESSWVHFQINDLSKALGNIHSLNAPFFNDSYFPEAPILAGVIFFYNCKYARVRYELEEFEYSYLPLGDEVDAILSEYREDNAGLVDWLEKLRAGEIEANERLLRILTAALDDKVLRRKLQLFEAIEKEKKTLESMPGAWVSGDLGQEMAGSNDLALSLSRDDAGDLVRTRLLSVKKQIVDLNVNRERILFEVARAEKGEIDTDMAAEMEVSSNVTQVERVEVSDEELYWTFDGEYWKDELGYYSFDVNTECKR